MLRPIPGDPWSVEQHHWNTEAKENQQLNPGGPSNRQKSSGPNQLKLTGGMKVDSFIEVVPVQWKIDNGARNTFISEETFESLLETQILAQVSTTYLSAYGSKVLCLGEAMM